MSDHDPICRRTFINAEDCICVELREYGERIAQTIERMEVSPNADDGYRIGWVRLRGIAARIAREGGSDE